MCKIRISISSILFFEIKGSPNKTIDIACIISFRLDRAEILNNIISTNPFLKKELFWLIKGSKVLFVKCHNAIGLLRPYLTQKTIRYSEMIAVLAISKAQIEIQHPSKKGLTTRAFESLGTKTKLITTNPAIRQYDFYNSNNILIIDRNNPVIS